jgi:arginine/ornithine N-succinyltransferase beta subunit
MVRDVRKEMARLVYGQAKAGPAKGNGQSPAQANHHSVSPVSRGSFFTELACRDVVIKSAGLAELKHLQPLASKMNSVNLPSAEGALRMNLQAADASFAAIRQDGENKSFTPGFFQFVAEETIHGAGGPRLIGACNITGLAGTKDNPYLYYLLERGALKLRQHPYREGPTTFGGCILDEPYRGSRIYPFSKLLSYARCWFLMRYAKVFRYPVFAEILPIKTDPPDRQNAFWSWFGMQVAGINLTYEQIIQQVHMRSTMLSTHMQKKIPLDTMPPEVAPKFDLAKPESRPAQRNLERINFRHAGRYYVVDGGRIVEATLQNMVFWHLGLQPGYPRVVNDFSFDRIGLIGTTADDGQVKIIFSPYSASPGNPGYIYLPREKMAVLGFDRSGVPGLVYALPVPLNLFNSFFVGREEVK